MHVPRSELADLMQEFVIGLRTHYPVLKIDTPSLTVDDMVSQLKVLFVKYLGEERVSPHFALPLDYLTYLMMVKGLVSDTDDWTIFYGRRVMLEVTQGDITFYGDHPVEKGEVRSIYISMPSGKQYNELATLALSDRVMWLSLGMNSSASQTYLCCDRHSHQFGRVIVGMDHHPWNSASYDFEHGSFLSYMRKHKMIHEDRPLRRLIGRMQVLMRAERQHTMHDSQQATHTDSE